MDHFSASSTQHLIKLILRITHLILLVKSCNLIPRFVMPRYTEVDVLNAINAAYNGLSIRKASVLHGIPLLTFRNRINGTRERTVVY